MRKFRITVNGKSYDVAVEELANHEKKPPGQGSLQQENPAKLKERPPAVETKVEPAKRQVQSNEKRATRGTGTTVTAPMPGVILDIKVTPAQDVKEGETLVVLEAMKMENEISSPVAGKVAEIAVKKGDSLNAGDLIITIE